MDIVPTPLPVPTFQATGDPSPAHLLEFLETLSGDLDRRPVRPNSQSNEVLSWTHLVSGLADHFLAYFPTPQELPWSAIHEKIKLTDISLRLIHRATERVELLFISSNDLAQNVFSRLLNLCYVLDIWVDVTVPKEDGYPSPEELQRKAVHTIVAVLRSLGGRLNVGSTKKTLLAHKTLKETLSECLACCNGAQPALISPCAKADIQTYSLFPPQPSTLCTSICLWYHVFANSGKIMYVP